MSTQPAKIQAMVNGLLEIGESCLRSLLVYFVTEKEFFGDDQQKYTTPANDAALSYYLAHKESVVKEIAQFINQKHNKKHFFEEGSKNQILPIIKIDQLDILLLRVLLLNVVDFETCYGKVLNSPRQSRQCTENNHKNKCCNTCDHSNNWCLECHESNRAMQR